MDKNEIIQYVEFGRNKSIIVDRSLLKNYHGHVRDTYIIYDFTVAIEFNLYNYDEGGLTFRFKYADYDSLISSLENYLGKKIEHWENFSKTGNYPIIDEINDNDIKLAGEKIKDDFANNKLELPKNYSQKKPTY